MSGSRFVFSSSPSSGYLQPFSSAKFDVDFLVNTGKNSPVWVVMSFSMGGFFFSTIKRKAMCKLMECTLYSTECSRC